MGLSYVSPGSDRRTGSLGCLFIGNIIGFPQLTPGTVMLTCLLVNKMGLAYVSPGSSDRRAGTLRFLLTGNIIGLLQLSPGTLMVRRLLANIVSLCRHCQHVELWHLTDEHLIIKDTLSDATHTILHLFTSTLRF